MLKESSKGQGDAHASLLFQEPWVMGVDEIHRIKKPEFVIWWCQLIREQVQLSVRKADSHSHSTQRAGLYLPSLCKEIKRLQALQVRGAKDGCPHHCPFTPS